MTNDAGFGDIEPEDAWDVNDPIVAQLHNLRRRVAAILADEVLGVRLRQRLEMIGDDLDNIRQRIVGN